MNEIADVLREARALVKKGWCKGWYARTASKRKTHVSDPKARSFCVVGALQRACGPEYTSAKDRAFSFLLKAVRRHPGDALHKWNDARGRTKTQVLAAFSRAIALAAQEEPP